MSNHNYFHEQLKYLELIGQKPTTYARYTALSIFGDIDDFTDDVFSACIKVDNDGAIIIIWDDCNDPPTREVHLKIAEREGLSNFVYWVDNELKKDNKLRNPSIGKLAVLLKWCCLSEEYNVWIND